MSGRTQVVAARGADVVVADRPRLSNEVGSELPSTKGHREYAEWTPERLITWAKTVGPMTAAVVEEIMLSRAHPQQGFNACLGIMRLRADYKDERIERACARAKQRRACSYRSVAAILQNNLDKDETPVEEQQSCLPLHENLRGSAYYG